MEREVDAIIFGTGFDVRRLPVHVDLRGLGGRELGTSGARPAQAYLGTMVAGFPNLFVLVGPNTGLGHNSMVFMIECQIRLAINAMKRANTAGAAGIAPTVQAQSAYNDRLQDELDGMVWSRSCKSWYMDAHGRNISLWPHETWKFRRATLKLKPDEYELVAAGTSNGAGTEADLAAVTAEAT